MKLSICIPIYDYDVNELVNDLLNQIDQKDLEADIILIDDASDSTFIAINKNLEGKVSQFIYLENNVGRSKVRNLFLKYSQAEYLLFLDCDGKIITENFLSHYFEFIETHHPDVIYGGRKASELRPSVEYGLRWKFATERENLPVHKRQKEEYLDFQTNNFVVRKSILEKIPFNEAITDYGYEDLVFSQDLQSHKIKINHIDNPIFNNGVETNSVFVNKADQSAKSLAQLIGKDKNFERVSQIKLAKAYLLMKKTRTLFLYELIYRLLKPYLQKKLLTGKSSLRTLDFYKLGQLIGYMNKQK
ncbi:MAG: glycosyltransferase [Weeksellaceae bacterium]|nr:glycosyltransferase [Weeksellaceae bacterium]